MSLVVVVVDEDDGSGMLRQEADEHDNPFVYAAHCPWVKKSRHGMVWHGMARHGYQA